MPYLTKSDMKSLGYAEFSTIRLISTNNIFFRPVEKAVETVNNQMNILSEMQL